MRISNKSFYTLELDKILNKLAGYAKTEQSKQLCLDTKPFYDINQIRQQLKLTREAKFVLDLPADIPIEFVADIQKIQKSMTASYLSEEELVDIAKTIRTSRLIKNFLNNNLDDSKILKTLSKDLVSDKDLEDKIFSTFDESLKIRQDATPELKGLYSALRDNEKNLKVKVNELLNSPDFSKHLQENIYTTRDDRIVFQVMASSKSKIPGIVHDVSSTNRTFYIEPQQIVPLNNKIREIKSKIHAELVRILVTLTNLVKNKINEIAQSEKIIALIDYQFAKARYAINISAIEPEIITDKIISIENMKHPLLIGNVENVVSNNIEIGKDYKSIIITGSNT